MLKLTSDGSEEAALHAKSFAEAGGIRATVQMLSETAKDVSRRASSLDPSSLVMDDSLQYLLMLGDVQTMGCTVLSNLAAIAEGGEAILGEELRVSNAIAAVGQSLKLYPDNPEHVEAALAALTQLLPIDPKAFLQTGAHGLVIESMLTLFLSLTLTLTLTLTLIRCS